MTVVISGTGLFTPTQVITNQELVDSFNSYVDDFNQSNKDKITSGEIQALEPSSAGFIEKASGIKQRYVIDKKGILDPTRMRPFIATRAPEEPSLQCEMALKAINQALDVAQINPQEVDGIIVACSNFQRAYPAISIEIAHFLQSAAFGFDMNVACSSATFGIATATAMIEAKQAKTIIVVNPEICSGHLNFRDRESHFIFGDACTALVLQEKSLAKVPHFQIIDTKLTTSYSNNIRNNQGFLTHTEVATQEAIPHHLFMQQGRKVFKEVIPLVCEHLLSHCNSNHIQLEDIKRLWLHQANRSMNELITKKVLNKELNELDAPIILDTFANTSSAGSIICFHQHHHDFIENEIGIICSFGAGYSIGSVLVRKFN
ncbi:beta-ketoacyl-ACP synthase III [Candidatus Berkiella cookevillensis]|uniref:3-oxoacyl-[acyl-carrier-protein] synthase 3 n=1 Tax=Candidatus Berkiella cookevillensis TaxID=437022 RepID=A0A0Q9YMH7_9GAMM|nr:beta-ketoacyl-ACP synthase III [Candidatus Berkiella cookevillensis]MCS5708037.1 beta-ketoacyl-ACP synthase III [Candidatus Berkiella cookevillensis]